MKQRRSSDAALRCPVRGTFNGTPDAYGSAQIILHETKYATS